MKRSVAIITATVAALVCVLAMVAVFVPSNRVVPSSSVPSGDSAERVGAIPEAEDGGQSAAEERQTVGDEAEPADAAVPDGDRATYEQGVVLVSLADSVSVDQALDLLREETGIADLSVVEAADSFVKLAFGGDLSVEDAVEAISSSSVVTVAQPNFTYYLAEDSEAQSVTGLVAASGQSLIAPSASGTDDTWPGGSDWHLKKVRAYDAWDYVNALPAGSSQVVTVAVIDVGFNLEHEDLIGDYVADPQDKSGVLSAVVDPYNAYSGQEGASGISTTQTHGTHVAGIVAAHAGNSIGVAGVTGNLVRIMPIQAFSESGSTTNTDTLLKCYSYIMRKASADNVRVINMSLGGGCADTDWSDGDMLLLSEISKAYDKGIVTVAAACNRDRSNGSSYDDEVPFYCYPGDYGQCVTVINTDSSDARYASSNYNRSGQRSKDISAPGASILSTAYSAYRISSGTSMATPVASSVLALIFETNPGLTADEAVSKLYSSAVDIGSKGWDAQTGYGRVDALAAVRGGAYLSGPCVMYADQPESYRVNLPSGVTARSASWSTDAASGSVSVSKSGVDGATVTASGSCEFVLKASVTGSDGSTYTAVQTITAYKAGVSGESALTVDQKATYSVEGLPTTGHSFTWATSNASIASISSGGVLTAKAAGSVVVTATDNATGRSYSKSVKINGLSLSTSNTTITGVADRAYTGKAVAAQKPTVKRDGVTLKAGTDYVLTYQNAAGKTIASSLVKNAGTYYVVVTGKGKYAGTVRKSFKVISPSVSYRAHVQNVGWQGWKSNGTQAGTTGRSLRMEAINLKVANLPVSGGVKYRAHVQNVGWQGWKSNGALAGTTGRSLRMEAVQIQLTGSLASYYDVYYRAHVQNIGWMGWAKNGARAGSAGYSYRMEALQVKLVPKGMPAPGSASSAFRQR